MEHFEIAPKEREMLVNYGIEVLKQGVELIKTLSELARAGTKLLRTGETAAAEALSTFRQQQNRRSHSD